MNTGLCYKKGINGRYTVALLSVLYILCSFFLSMIMPVIYTGEPYDHRRVLPFILGVCLCLFCGYYIGMHSKVAGRGSNIETDVLRREQHLLRMALLLSIISLFVEWFYLISVDHFTLLVSGLGGIYNAELGSAAKLVVLLRFTCAPCRIAAIGLGIYRFFSCSIRMRCVISLNIIMYFLVYLFGYGVQKGVSDVGILLALSLLVSFIRDRKSASSVFVIIIIFLMLFVLFSCMQVERFAYVGVNLSNYHGDGWVFNKDSRFFRIFGDEFGFGLALILNSYLSQGYYGLSLCMRLPFCWTYGIGSSYAILHILERLGIDRLFNRTYIHRMDQAFGRYELRSWNTIFPWLASDLTWFGAMLWFVVVGFVMAIAWKELIVGDNVLSFLMIYLCAVMILFIPANNQLLHGYDSAITTVVFIVIWLFRRRRYMHG